MTIARMRIAIGATVTVFGIAISVAARTTSAASVSPMMTAALQINCGECYQCFGNNHKVVVGADVLIGRHSTCEDMDCTEASSPPDGHAPCKDTFAVSQRAPQIFALVRGATADDIAAVVASLGDRVSVNLERQALQMAGCDSTIALSIPLTPEQARALSQ